MSKGQLKDEEGEKRQKKFLKFVLWSNIVVYKKSWPKIAEKEANAEFG